MLNVFSSVFQIKDKLDNIETKLMDPRREDLQNQIEALKKKTEQNRKMAKDAREAANSALKNTTDAEKVRLLKTDFNSWPCSIVTPVTMETYLFLPGAGGCDQTV